MRAPAWFLFAIAGCHPSATVEHTMPVANLAAYRSVGLRVHSSGFALQGQAMYLESATLDKLHRQCGFEQIGRAGATPADVMLDLNITNAGRGGGGFISNPNTATIDTLLVLTDGQSGELLGTARIHGKSSGMLINNAPPENEAIDVVATTVAEILAKSGCSGPRTARAELPPPTPTSTPEPGSNEAHRAEAEALNDQGKAKLQSADIVGALAKFEQASSLVPDARYKFNACLALEAQEKWNEAISACQQARGLNPQEKLAAKIDHRIDLLKHHQ